MKRIVSGFIACMALLLTLLVMGCANNPFPDDSKNDGGDGSGDAGDKTENVSSVDTIESINANPNYLDEMESFYDAENDYWIFNMGTIENVPLETPTFFYYGGKGEIEQTFTKETITVSGVSTMVQKVAQERMTWNVSAEIGVDNILKKFISGKISGSMEVEETTSEMITYSKFKEWTDLSKKSVTIRFDERYKAGYYAYLVFATVEVRAVLVRNRATEKTRVDTYNELVSYNYYFAYNESNNKPVSYTQQTMPKLTIVYLTGGAE